MGAALFTDEELVAYLDQALPSDRCGEIELMRASDPALQQRLAALEIDVDAIRGAFDRHLAAAPVDDLRQRLAANSSRSRSPRTRDWRLMQLAAAVLVGLALGAGGMATLSRTPAPDWHAAVAEYQALYTTETLKPLSNDPILIAHQVQHAATALGRPVPLANLQVRGLELKRAQVLAFRQQPLVQFAYLDREGTPIAFCATRTNSPAEPIQISMINGLAAAVWDRDGYGYMVIGGADRATIQAIARVLQQHT
jgi:anti-sigma factor RsiW